MTHCMFIKVILRPDVKIFSWQNYMGPERNHCIILFKEPFEMEMCKGGKKTAFFFYSLPCVSETRDTPLPFASKNGCRNNVYTLPIIWFSPLFQNNSFLQTHMIIPWCNLEYQHLLHAHILLWEDTTTSFFTSRVSLEPHAFLEAKQQANLECLDWRALEKRFLYSTGATDPYDTTEAKWNA